MKDTFNRLGNGALAFAGVIVSSVGPIAWDNPQFWGGVVLVVIPALRNSTDKFIPNMKGK